jgi:hypothetical protein
VQRKQDSFPSLFLKEPKEKRPKENKKRRTLLDVFCTSLKVETHFIFKSTKKPVAFATGFLNSGNWIKSHSLVGPEYGKQPKEKQPLCGYWFFVS